MTLVQSEPKKIYIWVEAELITTPGIYHNAEKGLISLSSDGSNWLTIADKNLGATSTDITSSASYGNYYQWGNNYGFPNTGSVTTSSTAVNASSYGPGNYYSSSTFVTASSSPYDWATTRVNNLWGGVTATNEAMKGPCNSGFHVPLNTELSNLLSTWQSVTGLAVSDVNTFRTHLKIPGSGYRSNTAGTVGGQGNRANLWGSNVTGNNAYVIASASTQNLNVRGDNRAYGFPIRPFANTPTQPDDSWDVLYQSTLKTYEQLRAMSYSDVITELNSHPTKYLNSLTAAGHIKTVANREVICDSQNNTVYRPDGQGNNLVMFYIDGLWEYDI